MANENTVVGIALAFFLVANSVGMTPTFVALLKDFDFNTQRKILFREGILALILAIFFLYLGELFLDTLKVKDFAVSISGGILLLLVSFNMIWPKHDDANTQALKKDPLIVPIATPLLSGPGLLTTILLYARQENNTPKILMAVVLSALAGLVVLMFAPYLQRFLGKRGLLALEQLMGMLLTMMSFEMIIGGFNLYRNYLNA